MALPVPPAVMQRAVRQGLPLLVAALLTLLLGWTALHEGQTTLPRSGHSISQAAGAPAPTPRLPLQQAIQIAESECEGKQPGKAPAAVSSVHARHGGRRPDLQNPHPAALSFRLAPLRQPPGHAPPYV